MTVGREQKMPLTGKRFADLERHQAARWRLDHPEPLRLHRQLRRHVIEALEDLRGLLDVNADRAPTIVTAAELPGRLRTHADRIEAGVRAIVAGSVRGGPQSDPLSSQPDAVGSKAVA